MKLNKTQRDYAIERLSDKIREKCNAEMPERLISKKDNKDALYDLLTKHGLQLVSRERFNNIWGVNYLNEAIIFPIDFDKEYEENGRIRKEIQDKYDAIKQQIMDKLYLCDEAQEALDLINSI